MNTLRLLIAAMFLSLAGCVPTEEQMLNLGNDVDLLMGKIDDQQSKLIAQIDKGQEYVTLINEAVKAAKTLPEKAAAGIEASRPFNPWADEMVLGLGLLTLIGGALFKKADRETKVAVAKYKSHKQGLTRAAMSSTPADMTVIYDEIGKARLANGV